MSVYTSVLKLFKYDPVADKKSTYNITQALNDNWDKIDAAMGAAKSAEEYNAAGTYAAGSYCTKDGKLYKCTAAITAGEAWTAGHWTETSVGAEIAAAYAALKGKAEAIHAANHATGGSDPLTPAQIGAAAADHTHTPAQIGAATADHTHTAAQVGADPAGSAAAVLAQLGDRAKIATGSYVGTGTVGSANPNTITAPFPIKLLFIAQSLPNTQNGGYLTTIIADAVVSLSNHRPNNQYDTFPGLLKISKSADGKSVSFYAIAEYNSASPSEACQLNSTNTTYTYVALG